MLSLTTSTGIVFPIHRLVNGLVVVVTSKHSFSFSDGSKFEGISEDFPQEFLKALRVDREFRVVQDSPFRATESTQRLSNEVLSLLRELSEKADIVLVPFMVIGAMKEMGIRSEFPKVVAFNATPETARVADVSQKVVDCDNWAW
ncbi:MAG: hypothetical protein PHH83_01005 [Patescibacteria group bacterium]|nr:hypothetical protein [Patescibacteria group bacterium]